MTQLTKLKQALARRSAPIDGGAHLCIRLCLSSCARLPQVARAASHWPLMAQSGHLRKLLARTLRSFAECNTQSLLGSSRLIVFIFGRSVLRSSVIQAVKTRAHIDVGHRAKRSGKALGRRSNGRLADNGFALSLAGPIVGDVAKETAHGETLTPPYCKPSPSHNERGC